MVLCGIYFCWVRFTCTFNIMQLFLPICYRYFSVNSQTIKNSSQITCTLIHVPPVICSEKTLFYCISQFSKPAVWCFNRYILRVSHLNRNSSVVLTDNTQVSCGVLTWQCFLKLVHYSETVNTCVQYGIVLGFTEHKICVLYWIQKIDCCER